MGYEKQNAKEYLKEFATSQPDWLKVLIYEVVETNGNISDNKKKEKLEENKTKNISKISELVPISTSWR